MINDGPPDFDTSRLDFSQFHALDHWPFSAYCRTQYGGGRVHLQYAWEFRRRDQVFAPWHWITCHLGRHDPVEGWARDPIVPPPGHVPGEVIPEAAWEQWRRESVWYPVCNCRWCGRPQDRAVRP